MHSLSIQFQNLNLWIIAIIFVIAIILFLTFRNKNQQPSKIRYLLMGIRMSIFIIISVIIIKPIIKWTTVERLDPIVAIFIDKSLSMIAHEDVYSDSLTSIIENIRSGFENVGANVKIFPFGSSLEKEIRSVKDLQFDAVGTDLSKMLVEGRKLLSDQNIKAGVVITDGVFTQGENPMLMEIDSRFPIYTVGIGDSLPVLDPSVFDISVPPFANVGDTVSIEARVLPLGHEETLTVFLEEDDQVIQKKVLKPYQQSLYQTILFKVIPDSPGIKRYSVMIDTLRDRNPFNNVKMTLLRVKSAHTLMIMIQGDATFESRFFARIIKTIPEMELIDLLEFQNKWHTTSQTEPFQLKWDAVALFGFPTRYTTSVQMEAVMAKLRRDQPAIFAQCTRSTDIAKLDRLVGEPFFDNFRLNLKNVTPVSVQIVKNQSNHPIIRDIHMGIMEKDLLAELPPVGMPFVQIELSNIFKPLIETVLPVRKPVIAIAESNRSRKAVVTGLDLWRWDMMTIDKENHELYSELLKGLVEWLTDTLSTSNIQFHLNKTIFLTGEVAEVEGIVTDIQGNLIKNAVINAELLDSRNNSTAFLIQWNGLKYSGMMPLRSEGEYQINAVASVGENELGRFQQKLTVLKNPVEFSTIRQNIEVLRSIAENTGGRYLRPDEFPSLIDDISLESTTLDKRHELKLWRWNGIFILLIFLLFSEWVIRRLSGYQ